MGRACSTSVEKMKASRILVGKPEGKRPLKTPIRKLVDNIKMDLREKGGDGVVWTGSIWLMIETSRGHM
jgi:hypothetical protein